MATVKLKENSSRLKADLQPKSVGFRNGFGHDNSSRNVITVVIILGL